MPRKNHLETLPKELLHTITIPKNIRKPQPVSIVNFNEKTVGTFMEEFNSYKKEVDLYVKDKITNHFTLLCRHYGTWDPMELLSSILNDLVPGFQVSFSRPGPKDKWSDEVLVKLLVEVQQKRRLHPGITDIAALNIIKNEGIFKGITIDALKKNLLLAKKLPHQQFARKLSKMPLEKRNIVINYVEKRAQEDLGILGTN